MAWFSKREQRAKGVSGVDPLADNDIQYVENYLAGLLGTGKITKAEALNIPSVKSCISFIASMVSVLPVKLYRETDGETKEILGDNRIRLLNDDTGDTLDAVQFWKALITDYFLGKGGYAYIHKSRNKFVSLHYVDESGISINTNTDPIFKDFDIYVNGIPYKTYNFIKLLRSTKNGAYGQSIIEESPRILSLAYQSLRYEESNLKNGGNKKGFLKSERPLSEKSQLTIKEAWKRLFGNDDTQESVMLLNQGIDFKEISNTSVEMQLQENKELNAVEICKLFNMSAGIIKGEFTAKEFASTIKIGVMPILRTIECALNRDFLLEKEKESFYFAFDTKELLRGDIKERFEAYKTGIEANVLQIDEARYMEDLPSLGLDWIKLGLDSVLYDPKTKRIFTANTGQTADMKGGEIIEDRDTERQRTS